MKFTSGVLIAVSIVFALSFSEKKTIELPLTKKIGYGPFQAALGGISPYSDDENNPWKKMQLKVTGVPEGLTDLKFGDIETNMYQSAYQNYHLGNISPERYEELQKAWDWTPDTLNLSKSPLKSKIAFVLGKDSTGTVKLVIDANNNLDLRDDDIITPKNMNAIDGANRDSIALANSIEVFYETFVDNKIVLRSAPLFISYMEEYKMLMGNFAEYATTRFEGEDLAVCSNNFINLSYNDPTVVLLNSKIKEGEKANSAHVFVKNEYIEIKGKLYKNIGVNLNTNSLILEKSDLSKTQISSTQVGYKSFSFGGSDFKTKSSVSLDALKGKYVLLDFWATWCGPCVREIPHLIDLYQKTDRTKFEIVSIVGDSPSEKLQEMIEKHSIIWPQVLSTDDNPIKERYGIHSYPTTFLLDPEGVIIAKNLRGKALEDTIIPLLKE